MTCSALLLMLPSILVLAAPAPKPMPADKYAVRVKTATKDGGVVFVPIAEVVREKGGVVAKAVAAPSLDGLCLELEKRWKEWKKPESVTITQSLASDTGMRPSYSNYSATFTAADKLYPAALLRQFADKYGYNVLGLDRTVDFIIYDSSAESPPHAHDRASTHSNFRKNPEGLNYASGPVGMLVYANVRGKPGSGGPRASQTVPTLSVDHRYDEGTLQIGRFDVASDGSITVSGDKPGDRFVRWFGEFTPEAVPVSVVDGGTYKNIEVAKDSPWNLEAQLVRKFEQTELLDISPVIDPAVFLPVAGQKKP